MLRGSRAFSNSRKNDTPRQSHVSTLPRLHRKQKTEGIQAPVRKSWDQVYLNIAKEMATMGTCHRRQVGCVLTDVNNSFLSSGINGVPSKWEHCRTFDEANPGKKCPGANAASGTGIDGCLANHAEMNALIRCADPLAIHNVYTTTSPCISCLKALLSTSARRIVFEERYPHPEAEELWTRSNLWVRHPHGGLIAGPREWIQLVNGECVYFSGSKG